MSRAIPVLTCCVVCLWTRAVGLDALSAQTQTRPFSGVYAGNILKSRNPESTQTPLEATVQREGRTALPLVWQALATGTESERRAAAALLAWYRDARSIQPILAELDKSPDAVIRQQLLFALSMILLTEGSPVDAEQTRALAGAHLRRSYEELADQTANDAVDRNSVLSAKTIAVFPDPGIPDSVALSGDTQRARSPRGLQLPTRVAATAARSESPQAFFQAVKNDYGVAFHITRASNGVARVVTTLYYPSGGAGGTWTSLYRQSGDQWVPIAIPSIPNPSQNGRPGLWPSIDRDYGADHPLKVLGLDFAMELIRVDVNARQGLGWEAGDVWSSGSRILDTSYLPLLEQYTQSGVPSVRYTAEFEKAILGQPNIQMWIEALAQPDETLQMMARRVIGPYATTHIEKEGRILQGPERDALVAAAIMPEPVAASLLPRDAIRRENVRQVQASTRFALVEVAFSAGFDSGRGYTMLFERRGNRWSYLFSVKGWLAWHQ